MGKLIKIKKSAAGLVDAAALSCGKAELIVGKSLCEAEVCEAEGCATFVEGCDAATVNAGKALAEGEMIFRDYLENFDAPSQPPGRIVPENGNAVYEQWSSSPYPVTDHFFVCDKPFVQIETSRGCPMGCFYCTSGGTRTRYRSLEQVREELQLLCFKGIKEIRVLDRTFNLPQERGAALLRMFREEFPQMRFHLELHPQFEGVFIFPARYD